MNQINAVITGASQITLAVSPLAAAEKIPQVAIYSSAEKYSSPGDLSLRISPRANDEIRPLLKWLAGQTKVPTGILAVNNEYGEGMTTAFEAGTQKLGISIAYQERFEGANSDFRTVLAKAKSNSVGVLFLAGLATHYGQIVKQAYELGYAPTFLTTRTGKELETQSVGSLANSLYFDAPFDPERQNSEVKRFLANYSLKFGQAPDSYAAEGYESVKLLATLLSGCRASVSCLELKLQSAEVYKTVFGDLRFDVNGDTIFEPALFKFQDGKPVKVE